MRYFLCNQQMIFVFGDGFEALNDFGRLWCSRNERENWSLNVIDCSSEIFGFWKDFLGGLVLIWIQTWGSSVSDVCFVSFFSMNRIYVWYWNFEEKKCFSINIQKKNFPKLKFFSQSFFFAFFRCLFFGLHLLRKSFETYSFWRRRELKQTLTNNWMIKEEKIRIIS